jgi:hypothetical protein
LDTIKDHPLFVALSFESLKHSNEFNSV